LIPAEFGECASYVILANSSVSATAMQVIIQVGQLGISQSGSINTTRIAIASESVHFGDTSANFAQGNLSEIIAYVQSMSVPPPFPVTSSSFAVSEFRHGIYENTDSIVNLGGTITINGEDNPFYMFVFQVSGDLTFLQRTTILLENSAQPTNIYWQVSGNVRINDNCIVRGRIFASGDIIVGKNVQILGQLMSQGSVTFAGGNTLVSLEIPITAPPTQRPTPAPTGFPTGQPSQAPSIAYLTFWDERIPAIQANVSALAKLNLESDIFNATDLTVVSYDQLDIYGDIAADYGGIDPWSAFIDASMTYQFAINKNVSAVQFSSVNSFAESTPISTKQCRSGSAYAIADALLNPPSNAVSWFCNGDVWKVKDCSNAFSTASSPGVCVNCDDPCSSFDCDNSDTISPVLTSNSSNANGTCTRQHEFGMYRYLAFGFLPPEPAPIIDNIVFTATRTSLTLAVTLSSRGTVYCGVVKPSSVQPTSVNAIKLKNNVVTTTTTNASLTISGIFPSTTYNVYCYTVSFQGIVMPTRTMLSTVSVAQTLCCKSLLVNILAKSIFENTFSASALTLSIASPPSDSITVELTTSNRSSLTENAFVANSVQFTSAVSSAVTVGYVAPSIAGVDHFWSFS